MKKYNIDLLLNGRVLATNLERGVVVAGESETTEITVNYPTSYADYLKYVYIVNARGECTQVIFASEQVATAYATRKRLREYARADVDNNASATFTLPSSMTFAGNTILRFVATKDDELVAWSDVPIPILKTALNYSKPAVPSQDEIAEFIRALEAVKKLLQQPDRAENGKDLAVSISRDKGNLVFENMSKLSPYVQDDNWWINGQDTGVKASAVGIDDISETDRQNESGASDSAGLYVVYTITYSDKHTQEFVVKDGELNSLQAHLLHEANAFATTANANSERANLIALSVRDDANSGKFNGRDGNDGINIPVDSGMYRLEIRSDGSLYLITASDNDTQPPLHIDTNGNLILTI